MDLISLTLYDLNIMSVRHVYLRFVLDISVSEYLTFSTAAILVLRAPYTNIIHLNNISIYNKF